MGTVEARHDRHSPTAPSGRVRPPADRLVWLAVAFAALPVIVAALRAILDGWLPMGDNAYFTVRSRDVLGPAHPLLGAWSSGSVEASAPVNNLGPLQLDLLAPFTKLDPSAGTAIGTAVVNLAAVVGIGIVIRRVASSSAVVVGLAVTSAVAWSMGSELLLEPRQHHALMLPFLCFLFLCWGTACGDRWLLPWLVAVASLLLQTHFSYVIITPLLGVVSLAALVESKRRAPRHDGTARWWSPLAKPVLVSSVVVAVLWVQTLVDQIAGTGNLSNLRKAGDSGGAAPPLGSALHIVSAVWAWPASWMRPGFRDFDPAQGLPGSAASTIALGALVIVLVGTIALARRRSDSRAVTALAISLVGGVAAVLAVSRTPTGSLGPVVGNYRWLWPLVGFTVFALVAGWTGVCSPAEHVAPNRRVIVPAFVALVLFTGFNLPASYQVPASRDDLQRRSVVANLQSQMRSVEFDSPVLIERAPSPFGEPYTYAVLAQIQDQGVEFDFPVGSVDINRFGQARRDDGRARQVLSITVGPEARKVPAGFERVAFASSLTRKDLDRSAQLLEQLAAAARSGELVLTADGAREVAAGGYPSFAAVLEGKPVSEASYLIVDLSTMVDRGLLEGSDDAIGMAEELIELSNRESYETVAVYLSARK